MPYMSPADGSEVNAALKLITQRALVLTRAAGAAIALNHQGSMICRASAGATAPSPGCRLDVSSGFSAECIRTGKALRCDDSEADPRVDVLTCRRIGVRSILAAPILFGQNVVGLLEVFSPQQFAFNDEHLAVAERLAQAVLRTPPPPPKPVPPPKLLVELEPAHRVFFRNLDELVFPRPLAPLKLSSTPARFWPDVFVPSRIPWEGLFQSLALHVMMLAVLGSTLQMLLVDRHPLSPRPFNKAQVIYYLPNEYASLIAPPSPPRAMPGKEQARLTTQTPLAVARERSKPAQAIISAPEVTLKQDLKLLHLISLNSLVPAMPLSATGRARLTTPQDLAEVVGPPPDLSTAATSRAMAGPAMPVIEPAPSLQQAGRRIGDIGIGRPSVVSPAPQSPVREQDSLWSRVKAALGVAGTSVVPPPPSANGLRDPKLQTGGGLAGNGAQVVPPPPLVRGPEGSMRGTPDGVALQIVPPPPVLNGVANPSRRGTGTLIAAGGQIVLPAPVVRGATAAIRGTADATSFAIVPPPPSANGLGSAGRQGTGPLSEAGARVVPPPPPAQGAGGSIRGGANGTPFAVVPPPPSAHGIGSGGSRGGGLASAAGSQIVPPPPAVLGAGNSMRGGPTGTGVAVVPPPPSVDAGASASLGSSARARMGAVAMPVAAPIANARADLGTMTRPNQMAPATTSGVLPPMDPLTEEPPTFEPVEVAVNLLGPTVPLPSSSYFSNQEIFLAEERVSSHESRLIKLVYEFLPYQPKLSDYGPDYPSLDKLRVTRDPGCDETLTLATSAINTATWPQAGRVRLNAKLLHLQEATLACYRTTADDYRRARERRH